MRPPRNPIRAHPITLAGGLGGNPICAALIATWGRRGLGRAKPKPEGDLAPGFGRVRSVTGRRFGYAAATLWGLAAILTVYIATVTGVPGLDLAIAEPAHNLAVGSPWLVWVARFFAAMGSGFVLAPLTVGVVVALWVRGHRWWSVWLAAAGIGGILISQSVKRLVDRQRPAWDNPLHELTSPSFPSGHAMAGIYGYLAFGVVAWFLGSRAIGVGLMLLGDWIQKKARRENRYGQPENRRPGADDPMPSGPGGA